MSRGTYYTKHLDETLKKGVYETGVGYDFLYKHSTTKDPEFDIGDRVCLPDGRVFRYAKAYSGMTFTSMKMAMCNISQLVAEYTSPSCVPTSAIAVGDRSAAFTVTAASIGVDRNGVIAKDELKGGYISFYGSSSYRPQRGIVGNSALANTGTSITIYFDAALDTAIAASSKTEIMANPYSRVTNATDVSSGHSAWLGMAVVVPAVSEYFWIQTWGIFRITPQGAGVGTDPQIRDYMFASNGGIRNSYASIVTEALSEQHAGFLMDYPVNSEAEDAAPFINLQINP